jgi:FMN phosphatase YigB (HAD superfamily)
MLDTILFDLDGTLLPLDENAFLKAYFGGLAKRFSPKGLPPDDLIRGLWAGTERMRENVGPDTNETVFWKAFLPFVPKAAEMVPEFERYYAEDFDDVRSASQIQPLAKKAVELLHQKGYRTLLATNPLFPKIATEKRVRWAGLDPGDFIFITTYETSSATKPSIQYYREVLSRCGRRPEECLMVGNDAWEDGSARHLGIPFFLLTDGLINDRNLNLDEFQKGTFVEWMAFVESLPPVPSRPETYSR